MTVGTSTEKSPRKAFSKLESKQKKKCTYQILTIIASDDISFAHITKLKADGTQDIAEILYHLLKNPQDMKKVKEFLFEKNKKN